MAWVSFLPGQVNSPSTTLTGDINDAVGTIPVAELGVFPAPGATGSLAVIGTGDTAETILYTAKSAATGAGNLTGCTRAYDSDGTYGVAASWSTGETIARNFCAHDFETICGNADDINARLVTGATDNAILRANGAGGGTTQGSSAIVDDNGAIYTPAGYGIGLGTAASPSYLLHIKGTALTDLPTYSAEFLDADNWTSADWTGSWATGWAHTVGNTTVLSHDHNAVNATKYQIAYTVTGRTAGSFTITFGGQTSDAISATGAWGPTSTGTGVLQITPTTDFNGTIVISIKSITGASTAAQVFTDSGDSTINQIRIGNVNTNILIGVNSGQYNTTGYQNISLGPYSLVNNTTGNINTAIGYYALNANTTGYRNFAIGSSALQLNTTGYRNIGIGVAAGYGNLTGFNNTYIGNSAGQTLTTGYTNSFIGHQAGYDTNQKVDAVNSAGFGANTFTTRSNQIVIGDELVVETHLRTGVYIGSTSSTAHTQPTARLHIAAGSATASTAPIKLTSGTLLTSAEAGAIEFLTDDFYATISTGPARKKIALARTDWGTWSPTLTWTGGTPGAITTVARYCQIDRVVHFHIDISSADSNAASALTITLPVDPVDNNDYTAVASRQIAGAGGATWSDPLGYINMDSADKKINFAAFTTGTDGQAIRIVVSGSYEVA